MMVFWDAGLVLLATPKTGTQALEAALADTADMLFRHPPRIKHMTPGWANNDLQRIVGPQEWKRFQLVAVMREPLDWLGSWYRYRSRGDIRGRPNSTHRRSFSEFLRGYLSDPQPPYARLGRQGRFLRDGEGRVAVDHLFAYENMEGLLAFLQERLGREIALDRVNASPRLLLDVDPDLAEPLERHLAEDLALYRALTEGGDWKSA